MGVRCDFFYQALKLGASKVSPTLTFEWFLVEKWNLSTTSNLDGNTLGWGQLVDTSSKGGHPQIVTCMMRYIGRGSINNLNPRQNASFYMSLLHVIVSHSILFIHVYQFFDCAALLWKFKREKNSGSKILKFQTKKCKFFKL